RDPESEYVPVPVHPAFGQPGQQPRVTRRDLRYQAPRILQIFFTPGPFSWCVAEFRRLLHLGLNIIKEPFRSTLSALILVYGIRVKVQPAGGQHETTLIAGARLSTRESISAHPIQTWPIHVASWRRRWALPEGQEAPAQAYLTPRV